MPIITSLDGKRKDVSCIGCALRKGIIKTRGGLVFSGRCFVVEQDFEVPIPGFFVISSRRHIKGFADFNDDEKKEFIEILCKVRRGMEKELGIELIDLLFRESIISSRKNPSHFHVALLPSMPWMKKMPGYCYSAMLDYAKKNLKTKNNLKKVDVCIEKMKRYLAR